VNATGGGGLIRALDVVFPFLTPQKEESTVLRFQLSREVKLGEVLTSLTVIVSLITLTINWALERQKNQKEQANLVRIAASESWDKLDRWREISSSYQDLDPIFVETSEILKREKDDRAARDFLWKNLINSKAKNDRQILEEKLEQASAKLYSYDPELYKVFACTIRKLREAREEAFSHLLNGTQDVILESNPKDWHRTELIGNNLRGVLGDYRRKLQDSIAPPLEQTRSVLFQIIRRKDDEINSRDVQPTEIDLCK
jgi:hypothetical protein